jgi:GTPase SAR1 family protein
MLSLSDFPSAPLIHAASLKRRGRRILLVGPKGGGKTTLSLRLIQEGYDIEGDENVFVTGGAVVARPRALRVKSSTASLFPAIEPALRLAPYYQNGENLRIYNLDPRKVGARSWHIEKGPVAAVVLLRPNHNSYSSLRTISPLSLAREVIAESAFREGDRREGIRDIIQMVSNARGLELSLGCLDGAVSCLDEVCC